MTSKHLVEVVFHGRKKRLRAYVSTMDTSYKQTGKVKLWNHDGTPFKRRPSPEISKAAKVRLPGWHVEIDPKIIVDIGTPRLLRDWKVRYREAREKLPPEFLAELWP